MNIQKVEERIVEYPELEAVNKNQLKKCLPKRWIKLGITAFVFELIMKKNAFAIDSNTISDNYYITAGVLPKYNTVYDTIESTCNIVSIISIILSIVSIIYVIWKKLNSKKHNKNVKVKKHITIIMTVSIVLFLISIVVNYYISPLC